MQQFIDGWQVTGALHLAARDDERLFHPYSAAALEHPCDAASPPT